MQPSTENEWHDSKHLVEYEAEWQDPQTHYSPNKIMVTWLLEDPLYPPCCASWSALLQELWQPWSLARDRQRSGGWCRMVFGVSGSLGVCRFVWIYHHCKNIDFMKGLCILLHLSDRTFRVKILVDMHSFIFRMLLQVAGGKRRLSLASPPSLTSIWSCSTLLLFQKWRDKKSSLSKYVELNSFPLFSPCDFSSGSRHQIPQHFPNHRQVLVRFVLYLDVSEQVMEVPRLGGKMAASLVGNETKLTNIWNKSHLLHCKKWLDHFLTCKDWGLAVLFCSMLFCEEAYLFHWSALAFFSV